MSKEKTKEPASIFDNVDVEETRLIEEGKYTGEIIDVKRNNDKYDYIRYVVKVEGEDMNLDISYPTRITIAPNGDPSSQHATFLKLMGAELTKDMNAGEVIASMVGRKISFLVEQNKTDRGTFSQIVRSSVKTI